ncbi:MAG: T9SS type A sorting domain-containing protein, partial [Saprospiraceae bacterium]
MPRFSNSLDQYYLNFPTTPLYLGQMFTGGWSGAIVIQRLHLDGFVPGTINTVTPSLDVDIQISPNPATDLVQVNLDFGKNTPFATVSLMNGLGQTIRSERLSNYEAGQVNFNVKDLASGMYLLRYAPKKALLFKKLRFATNQTPA